MARNLFLAFKKAKVFSIGNRLSNFGDNHFYICILQEFKEICTQLTYVFNLLTYLVEYIFLCKQLIIGLYNVLQSAQSLWAHWYKVSDKVLCYHVTSSTSPRRVFCGRLFSKKKCPVACVV